MPIYEYRCRSCGHTLDALQKVNDPHLTDCPACNEAALVRLMSAPSFRLKGGGWYETDFKSDKERKRNLADGKVEGGDEKARSGGDEKTPSGGAAKSDTAKDNAAAANSAKSVASGKEGKSGSSGRSGNGTEAA